MEFVISRASTVWEDKRPHKNAYLKKHDNGESWFIKINTLDELLDFIKQINEDIIITQTCIDSNIYKIEIYDDYRE